MGEHFHGDDPRMGQRAEGTGNRVTDADSSHECFRVLLGNPRRRRILEVLTDHGETTLRALTTRVTALERGVPPDAVTERQRREVAISLYHLHLPKLAEIGLLTVEEEMERIRAEPVANAVLEVLGTMVTEEDPGDDVGRPTA